MIKLPDFEGSEAYPRADLGFVKLSYTIVINMVSFLSLVNSFVSRGSLRAVDSRLIVLFLY